LYEHHHDYARLVSEHFEALAEKDIERNNFGPIEHPVKEVILIRDYQGTVGGVLQQVGLMKEERMVEAMITQIEQTAKTLDPSYFPEDSELGGKLRADQGEVEVNLRGTNFEIPPEDLKLAKRLDLT